MSFLKNICFISIFFSNVCAADMPYISLEERELQALAIVVGEVVGIQAIKFPSDKFSRKIAIVKIKHIEKGSFQSDYLLISFGRVFPDHMKSSQEINVKLADGGKWFLNQDETGLFVLNRPDNFISN